MEENASAQGGQELFRYFRLVQSRWSLVVAIAACVFLNVLCVTMLQTRHYVAEARIKVASPDAAVAVFNVNRERNPDYLQDQIQIIHSPIVLHPVIERLNLRQRWAAPEDALAAFVRPIQTWKHRFYYPLAERLHLREAEQRRSIPLNAAYNRLRGRVNVARAAGSNFLCISVEDTDSRRAAEIANAIAEAAEEQGLAQRRLQIEKSVERLRKELGEQEKVMIAAQQKLDQLRRELNIPTFMVTRPTDETAQRLAREKADLRTQIVAMETRLQSLRKLKPEELRNVVSTIIKEPNAENLHARLRETELKLQVLREGYGPAHPEVLEAVASRNELLGQLDSRLAGVVQSYETELAMARAKEQELEKQLTHLRQGELALDEAAYLPYRNAQRNEEMERGVYNSIKARLQAELFEMKAGRNPVSVIERAAPDGYLVRPKVPRQLAMGAMGGLAVGLIVVLLLDFFNTSIRRIDEVESLLGRPVLAVVPQQMGRLAEGTCSLAHTEVYRMLRNHIEFTQSLGSGKNTEVSNSVVMLSAGAGEGKSLTTANLACVCAQKGLRVLVVDCDLYRPTIQNILGADNDVGMIDYLRGKKTIEEIIRPSRVPNVAFIPAGGNGGNGHAHDSSPQGPPAAMPEMPSERVQEFTRQVSKKFDVVLYDTPPLLAVSDATIVARAVGTSIFVIQHGRYPRKMAQRALEVIKRSGVNLLGVVVNNVDPLQADLSSYYQSEYESYYTKPVSS